MVEITNLQSIMPALNSAIGSYFWKIVFILLATIPVWILTTAIKDWWILKRQREELIKDSILSLDSYYLIDNCKGFLRVIGSRLIKLEEPDHTTHHIPIKRAIDGSITKLHYKEESESESSDLTTSEKIAVIQEVIKN